MPAIKTKNSFVRISKHAIESLEDRVKLELYQREVLAAFEDGELLSDEEARLIFLKGIDNARYWRREYRKYDGHVYIFALEDRGIKVLVTVI